MQPLLWAWAMRNNSKYLLTWIAARGIQGIRGPGGIQDSWGPFSWLEEAPGGQGTPGGTKGLGDTRESPESLGDPAAQGALGTRGTPRGQGGPRKPREPAQGPMSVPVSRTHPEKKVRELKKK